MNKKAQMPMAATELSSGNPLSKREAQRMGPSEKAENDPAFRQQTRNAHLRNQAEAASPASLHAFIADALRDQEGQFQRLAGVEPRIAGGLIAVLQIDFLQSPARRPGIR